MDWLTWLALGLAVWAVKHSRQTRADLQELREQVRNLLQRQALDRLTGKPERDTSATAQSAADHASATHEPPAASWAPAVPAQPEQSDALTAPLPTASTPQAHPAQGGPEPIASSKTEHARPPPSPRGTDIDWERWIGVRGAAVVGGAVLALAGILFFKYSVEHNLVPPTLRVASGVLAGLACVVMGLRLPRAQYAVTGDALVGGGLVALYAAFWAAHTLYGLIGAVPAFGLLALTTVVSGTLAVRLPARLVAVLGLVGGFATPLLLQSGHRNPVGLFGYILLLDAGVMLVARRLWPPLAVLSLVGTALYQVAWVVFSMRPEDLGIGVAVLIAFAALYILASPRQGPATWWQTQLAAILLPFLGALYLTSRAELGAHFYPVGGMLLLLDAGVLWMGRRAGAFAAPAESFPWTPQSSFISMAAAANVAVYAVWAGRQMKNDADAWEGLSLACALAAVFCAGELWHRRRPQVDAQAPYTGARLATCGLFVVTPFACIGNSITYWPTLLACLTLSLLASWLGNRSGQEWLQTAAAAGLAAVLGVTRWAQVRGLPVMLLEVGAVFVGMGVLWSLLAQARRTPESRDGAECAVAAFVCVALAGFVDTDSRVIGGPLPAILLGYGVLGLAGLAAVSRAGRAASTRTSTGAWGLACAVTCAWAQGWAASAGAGGASAAVGAQGLTTFMLCLLVQVATLALFTLWPFFAGARAQASRWTWYTAAAASPLHLVPLLFTVRQATQAGDGAVAVALGAVSFAALRALRRAPLPEALSRGVTAWLAAAALGMVSIALPLQLEDEWLLIGWALEGLAVTELWVRLQHRALTVFATALFCCVGARLLFGADEVYQFHGGGTPVFNFLMYTYWVPALCLVGAAWRARSLLASPEARPLFVQGCMLAGLAMFFVWINLCIAQAYGAEHTLLSMAQGDNNARNLTQSVAWALYALAVLAAGVKAASGGLRWVSLALLMVTAAKVFLFDLGDLEDLYRVASLVGLALSLITVSLCYQRFVFAPLRENKS